MSNVLVYSGPGVSASALSHTLRTLRKLLPSYDVQCINAQSLAQDPWIDNTALFVLPGGRDLPYVEQLSQAYNLPGHSSSSSSSSPSPVSTSGSFGINRRADKQIRDYVENHGGSFIGICAGAYYASARCEFERQDAIMRVVGERDALQFFPGTCSGTAYPGFVYESDQGARLVDIAMIEGGGGSFWPTYYNGGGAFIDAKLFTDRGVEVLGTYVDEKQAPMAGSSSAKIKPDYIGQAAIVRCKVGRGQAILYGTHPEFPVTLHGTPSQATGAPETLPRDEKGFALLEENRLRSFGRHLQLLGLEVELPKQSMTEESQLKLSPIILTTRYAEQASVLVDALRPIAAKADAPVSSLQDTHLEGHLFSVVDSNDTVHLYSARSASSCLALVDICAKADYSPFLSPVVAPSSDEARAGQGEQVEMEVDLQKVPKYVVVTSTTVPAMDKRLTPHWSTTSFLRFLDQSRDTIDTIKHVEWANLHSSASRFGQSFSAEQVRLADVHTYAFVVTSTQTMLDKNYRLLTRLPTGLTSFATHQVSGRGRGKNAWISPLGCLQFSTLLRIPSPQQVFWHAGMGAVVFVQYLAGLAIVESVRSGALGAGYAKALGDKIRIKWPNDVYAEVGDATAEETAANGASGGNDEVIKGRKGTFAWRGKRYAKMAGVLVNSQFTGTELALVVGCGINTLNARPTTSLSDLIDSWNASKSSDDDDDKSPLPFVGQEQFAGAILATFERMWNVFVQSGGNFAPFVDAYRSAWLHSNQETVLRDSLPPTKARIVGITSDYGLLRCVPLASSTPADGQAQVLEDTYSPHAWGASNAPGGWIDLQPDGNSFDMLQNLIRRKE